MLSFQEQESLKMFMKQVAHGEGSNALRNWGWINQTLISVHPAQYVSLGRVRNVAHQRSEKNDLAMVFSYDTQLKEIIGSFYVEYVEAIPDDHNPHDENFVSREQNLIEVQKLHDRMEMQGERDFYWFDSEAPDHDKPYLRFAYGKWAMLPEM